LARYGPTLICNVERSRRDNPNREALYAATLPVLCATGRARRLPHEFADQPRSEPGHVRRSSAGNCHHYLEAYFTGRGSWHGTPVNHRFAHAKWSRFWLTMRPTRCWLIRVVLEFLDAIRADLSTVKHIILLSEEAPEQISV
jgi:hypothetical protein